MCEKYWTLPAAVEPAGHAVLLVDQAGWHISTRLVPSHLGNVGVRLEALRDDPGLLLGRPPSSPALPGDHFDTTIRVAFLPGIKHGICHRLTSNDQLMPGCIAGESRDGEVRASCRLRSTSTAPSAISL